MPSIKPGTHAIDFGDGNVIWMGDDDIIYFTSRDGRGNKATALFGNPAWFELDAGEIDPTVGPVDYRITIPKGYYFIATRWAIITAKLNGTLTSSAVANCGNDAAKLNILASSANSLGNLGQINTLPAFKQTNQVINSTLASIQNLVSTDSPFVLQITTPAVLNTATIYRIRCYLNGLMVPV